MINFIATPDAHENFPILLFLDPMTRQAFVHYSFLLSCPFIRHLLGSPVFGGRRHGGRKLVSGWYVQCATFMQCLSGFSNLMQQRETMDPPGIIMRDCWRCLIIQCDSRSEGGKDSRCKSSERAFLHSSLLFLLLLERHYYLSLCTNLSCLDGTKVDI